VASSGVVSGVSDGAAEEMTLEGFAAVEVCASADETLRVEASVKDSLMLN
jgi:hypothetical protein